MAVDGSIAVCSGSGSPWSRERLLIAWLALPSGAIAKQHQKGKGLALKFKGSTQSDQALLSSGNVSVVVKSSKKRKLVLAVRGFGGGPALTDPLRVKAKAGKKKSVSASAQRDRQGGPAGLRREHACC